MTYEVIQADLNQDRETILALWNRHHDRKLDKKYKWIYEDNPDGKAMVWLVREVETGEYVGMTTLFPRHILYKGKIQLSMIAGDLFISPDHRTLKSAIMLQRAVLASLDSGKASSIYTFPNKKASLVMRRVGYKYIASMVRMVWLLHSDKQLQKRGINKILSKVIAIPLDWYFWLKLIIPVTFFRHKLKCINIRKFDQQYEELWSRCKKHFSVGLDKSASYMNWKYIDDPGSHSKVFCVADEKDNRMQGCIVYRVDEYSIEIRDLVMSDNDRVNRYVIYRFLKYIKQLQPESVYVSVLDNSYMKERLQNLCFMQGSKGRDIYYYNSPKTSDDMSAMSDSQNWRLMNCDDDT